MRPGQRIHTSIRDRVVNLALSERFRSVKVVFRRRQAARPSRSRASGKEERWQEDDRAEPAGE